ncbi:alpha/beta hydrolase [Tumidithrix helvetica PCC 7403]|uniref:alpha/beta fold hydrolase n=1 Tax=Tumidithrix helvetica TaxID=3457545 RepID=UPI003C93FA21
MTTTLLKNQGKIQRQRKAQNEDSFQTQSQVQTETKVRYQSQVQTETKPQSQSKAWINGRNLHYETFGDPSNPAVLLISDLASQCLSWFPYFYEPIVEQGYFVIRFDHRDIGLSDWIASEEWNSSVYRIEDMAQDAIGLLDALNIEKAHIIGASMGGMIAQRMAISHPTYVRTLTSMLSAAEASKLKFNLSLLSAFDASKPPLEVQLRFWSMLAGTRYPFDTQHYQDLYHEGFVVRQGYNPQCFMHHLTAIQLSGTRLHELGRIQAPTLVVHGTEDPLISEAHASVYAQEIPKATYLALDGVGHEIPQPIAPTVLSAIFNLFSKV